MRTKQTQRNTGLGHHVKKLLVPHKENEFRPHLIRARGIIAVLLAALVLQFGYTLTTTGQPGVLGQAASIKASDLLALTNKEREAQKIGDLQLNDALSQAAFLKAQDMFEAQYWAHTSPSGVQPWKWFADVGYNYGVAGENLAKNYPTAQATIAAWMNSDAHRQNMLNNQFKDVGFAVVEGSLDNEETTVIVALYGAPVTALASQTTALPSDVGTFFASTLGASSTNPIVLLASAVRALNPVSFIVLVVLAGVGAVGLIAHRYRKKLPKSWQTSWRAHHGLYTFLGMAVLGVLLVMASASGSL